MQGFILYTHTAFLWSFLLIYLSDAVVFSYSQGEIFCRAFNGAPAGPKTTHSYRITHRYRFFVARFTKHFGMCE